MEFPWTNTSSHSVAFLNILPKKQIDGQRAEDVHSSSVEEISYGFYCYWKCASSGRVNGDDDCWFCDLNLESFFLLQRAELNQPVSCLSEDQAASGSSPLQLTTV